MTTVLKISEAASLALHTMVYLAEKSGSQVATSEIAGALHRSEFHLSKVLQRLSRQGLVRSVRGPKGGFMLGGKGLDTTLLEVFEAIESPIDPNPCILGTPVCCWSDCILGSFVGSVNKQFTDYMGKKKLGHFMKSKARRGKASDRSGTKRK
ncbi:MAG: RrF2 family transcriptional regulator [Planctomycetota bacterium]|jgi:Rrf2 family protein